MSLQFFLKTLGFLEFIFFWHKKSAFLELLTNQRIRVGQAGKSSISPSNKISQFFNTNIVAKNLIPIFP